MTYNFRNLKLQREGADVPVYRQIAIAIEDEIKSGRLAAGEKLPTQRQLAKDLGLNLTTITRAYTELKERALVTSGTRSGTYVTPTGGVFRPSVPDVSHDADLIDLTINRAATHEYTTRLAKTMSRLAQDSRFVELQDYHPAEGATWARQAGKKWIELSGMEAPADRIIVTSGAQDGLFNVLSAITRPGDVVLTNQITYYGMKALADLLHVNIHGLPTDEDGLLPHALDEACCDSRVRAVFSVPCIHNPTAITIPRGRREEIAAVARKHELYVIEDDVYGPLLETRPPPIAALYPERTFYVTGTSKTLAPGLRLGYVLAPKGMVAPIADTIRATCWMVSPLSQLIASQWLEDGTAIQLVDAQRRELMARQSLAEEILKSFEFSSSPVSTHLWLHLPSPWRATEFATQVRSRGVTVLPSEVFAVGRAEIPHAVRINVGAAHSREELARGLRVIASTLSDRPKVVHVHALP